MSDRLAVFNGGRVEQVGTPGEVYESPRNSFVAGFVGVSNIVDAELAERLTGRRQPFTIRPEKITIAGTGTPVPDGSVVVDGTVIEAAYLGMYSRYRVDIGEAVLLVASQNLDVDHGSVGAAQSTRVRLFWSLRSCRPLAQEDGAEGVRSPQAPDV